MSKKRSASLVRQDELELLRLEHSLQSPLRLRLLAEIFSNDDAIALDEAVVRAAAPADDVVACLRPMVGWGVLEETVPGERWRFSAAMPKEHRALLRRAIQRSEPLARDRRVRRELLAGMVGVDSKMQLVAELVRQVSRLDVPVLITGESGTGKELVARAIHELSSRRGGFFGGLNCATLTETLFESQMFGHARGAFTDAHRAQLGLVERCHQGSLFLDEIAELSAGNQVKLLRVLQEKTFTRLGETSPRISDFRLISATNRDLMALVDEGAFREDLFYRLNVFPIRVPALRERVDDLPYLVDDILARHAAELGGGADAPAMTPGALERLRRHAWPGNIRELQNVVVRAAILAAGGEIEQRHLIALDDADHAAPLPRVLASARKQETKLRSLALAERDHVRAVLEAVDGNISAAAEILEISRTTLYKKLKDHGLVLRRVVGASASDDGR